MQVQHPFGVVTPTLDGDVLTVLAGADADFTPPQVHAILASRSVEGVRKALQRLSDEGIVTASRHGHAVLYRLNRQHVAADAVLALSRLRTTLIERISARIATWPTPPVAAVMFGSAATGQMRHDSDIDLFVVRSDTVAADEPGWTDQLRDLEASVTAWTGNDTRILEYAQHDLAVAEHDPVLDDIAAEGVMVFGEIPKRSGSQGGAQRTKDQAVRRSGTARPDGQSRTVRRRG